MNQISEQMARDFLNRRRSFKSNTEVTISISMTKLYLHGNMIAVMNHKGHVWITNHDWPTMTTRRRLEAILSLLENPGYILAEQDEWYYRSISKGKITEEKFNHPKLVRIR